MPSSTCSGEDVLGASYPTTSSCPGRVPTITSERGAWMAPGSRYMPSCAKGCVAWLAESLLPAPPSSTPKRSRLPREVVLAVTTVARQMSSRKRHLLVDTSGLVLNAVVHPADVADRDGARLVLAPSVEEPSVEEDRLPRLKHLWADAGYRGAGLREWITERLGLSMEIVQRRRRWVWVPNDVEPEPLPEGFEVIKRRWVAERTFAWITRNRRMSRDYEFLAQTTEALVYLSMIRLMLKRLANGTVC